MEGFSSPSRRKMRKGTRSCTECRRRKVRCIFASESTTCTLCLSRGSKCVDQLERPFHSRPIPEAQYKKATRSIEPLVLFQEGEGQGSDLDGQVDGGDDRPPLVSFLHTAEKPIVLASKIDGVANEPYTSQTSQSPSKLVHASLSPPRSLVGKYSNSKAPYDEAQAIDIKSKAVCENLRAALPEYDKIISTLAANGAWWASFRQKSHAIYDAPKENLLEFAARSYTSKVPTELGLLVTAYARSINKANDLYTLVDSLIISDLTYSATLDGLECLILLAKSYTDIGQPRRAWLTWRKGMANAQLMGVYRAMNDERKQRLWWAIYHGDRFTSLILGMPCGFSDVYYNKLAEASVTDQKTSLEHRLVFKTAVIAGQIIDRNISLEKPSFSKTMDLDQQMEDTAASMPRDWWKLPVGLRVRGTILDQVLERLLQQYFFYHVKMYLHLPFLSVSTPTPAISVSQLACSDAALQMLKIFLIFQSKIDRNPLFECKTSDFVSFTAAVVLLLAPNHPNLVSKSQDSDDRGLLKSVWNIFCDEEKETKCKIASQCQEALGTLLGISDHTRSTEIVNEQQEIRIPYFGIVTKRWVREAAALPVTSFGHSSLLTPSSENQQETIVLNNWLEGQNSGGSRSDFDFSFDWEVNFTNDFSAGDQESSFDPSWMDIDGDWSLLSGA